MAIATAKKVYVNDNSTTHERIVLCFAELLGTGMLVFLGCTGCVGGSSIPHLQISFTFGLAIMVAVQCFGHISGAHINPAVTVAAAVLGHIPLINVPIYILGQFLGGLGGYALLLAITPADLVKVAGQTGICSPGGSLPIAAGQVLLGEFLLTLILVLVCTAVWDGRNAQKHDSVAIRLGLAVGVLAMAGGAYTGANMNPARSFAPAVFNGDWKNHWAYWIGPLAAGLVGGILYRFIFSKEIITPTINSPEGLPLNDKA